MDYNKCIILTIKQIYLLFSIARLNLPSTTPVELPLFTIMTKKTMLLNACYLLVRMKTKILIYLFQIYLESLMRLLHGILINKSKEDLKILAIDQKQACCYLFFLIQSRQTKKKRKKDSQIENKTFKRKEL